MDNSISFEKLIKYQMKRIKEYDRKVKPVKPTEDQSTDTHNYALVSEIQCLVANLLQFVKIIKHATSVADSDLPKRERNAEDLLAGVMHNIQQMKGRLSQYQEKVCIPRLQAKEIHLQKQQQEMEYIMDCLCSGNTESLTRFAIDSSDVIKSRIENLSATGKDIGILQGEVSHLTSDVNDIVDIVKDLITSVSSSAVSHRSSETGLFMRRLASLSRDDPSLDGHDTANSSQCSLELVEHMTEEVKHVPRIRSEQDAGRRSLPSKLVSETSLGTSAMPNDGVLSDPLRVLYSDSAVFRKLQMGTTNSAFVPAFKKLAPSAGRATNQPEAVLKSKRNQLDLSALSRVPGSGEQTPTKEVTQKPSDEGFREQEDRKPFVSVGSPESFATAFRGRTISSMEEEMAHATFVKTVVEVDSRVLPDVLVADANSQTHHTEIVAQYVAQYVLQNSEHQRSEADQSMVLENATAANAEAGKEARLTPTEIQEWKNTSIISLLSLDEEMARISPVETQEGGESSITPTEIEDGRKSSITAMETKEVEQINITPLEFENRSKSNITQIEIEDGSKSRITPVDIEDRSKSRTTPVETKEAEKINITPVELEERQKSSITAIETQEMEQINITPTDFEGRVKSGITAIETKEAEKINTTPVEFENRSKSRITPVEIDDGSKSRITPVDNEDGNKSRITPVDIEDGSKLRITPVDTEDGNKSRITPVDIEGMVKSRVTAIETQEVEKINITPIELEERRKSSITVIETQEVEKTNVTPIEFEERRKSSITAIETKEREMINITPAEFQERRSSITLILAEMGKKASITRTGEGAKSSMGLMDYGSVAKEPANLISLTPSTLSPSSTPSPSPHAKARSIHETKDERTSMTSVLSSEGARDDASTYSTQNDMDLFSAVAKERIKEIQNLIGLHDLRDFRQYDPQNAVLKSDEDKRTTSKRFLRGFGIFVTLMVLLICLHSVIESNMFSDFGSFEQVLAGIIQVRPPGEALY
ncbi:uncharacterized protein LOC121390608 [Gigantopelta aegis]|uniref:uncharacterized protein LOC121390608 n=1 Tax=Gigantopelta aegis TaxID=1735272 RepID=UPI001B88C712|nr:uncharacterized protein LOC121390608 [Gigantopelta aegis]